MTPTAFTVIAPEEGHTLAKVLRSRLHASAPSWKDVRAHIEGRRVKLNDGVCTDDTRRLKEGDRVELLTKPDRLPRAATVDLVFRHFDEHVVVVEKPAKMNTVRHPAEFEWTEQQRKLDPTLQDLTQWAIARRQNRPAKSLHPLRIVHRLDRETSGLVCFARSVLGERMLGMQFRKHTVIRRYLALVPGIFDATTIRSNLVRDRGNGRRGSTTLPGVGKPAVTHVSVEESLVGHTLLSCRLETGRTHQIRIHLSEAGHPVIADRVYGTASPDIARLALHATELGFAHPATQALLHWTTPMPSDMQLLIDDLRPSTTPEM